MKGVPIWEIVKSLEALYETCNNEFPWVEHPEDYPQIVRAKEVLDKIKEEGVICRWEE